jgi:hypothetical protein
MVGRHVFVKLLPHVVLTGCVCRYGSFVHVEKYNMCTYHKST